MKWEVRTMRSVILFFNWTVYKKTVARFWPLWAAYFVIWLIFLPLQGLMYLRMDANDLNGFGGSYMENFARNTVANRAGTETILMLAILFGVLGAMAVFSHLYNARSANLFGSLPVRREGLFISHYLAGLSFTIVPNLAIFLLTLLVEGLGGYVYMDGLLFWLAVTCGECFFFYTLAVFCGMFTGHILALPAFYAIVNMFAYGVTGLLYLTLDSFYYGFAGFSPWVEELVEWLTPAIALDERVWYAGDYVADTLDGPVTGYGFQGRTMQGMGTLGAYALVAVALAVCAFLLYRARRLESAGDVVSVRPMRPVFQYGMAFCVGMVFGVGTTAMVGGGEYVLMAAILVWGVIGYFAARMLLDKSFRVFKKWKGAVAVAGVFAALFLVVGLDLTGYETRVPDAAGVKSVFVDGLSAVRFADGGDTVCLDIEDPGQIALLTAMHRAAVEDRSDEWHDGNTVGCRLELDYTLNDGSTLRRSYYVNIEPQERDQEGAAAWALEQLYHNTDLYWRVYGFDVLEEEIAGGGRLDSAEFGHYDEEWGSASDVVGYGDDARALLDAVEEDMRAGRIGVRTLAGAEDSYRYNPRDCLSFRVVDPVNGELNYSLEIALQDTATSTLAELGRLEANLDNEYLRDAFEEWLK